MSTDSTKGRGERASRRGPGDPGGPGGPGNTRRFADVIRDDGHAWVLAHDSENWFYECLRCGERAHVVTLAQMEKAVKHNYAYMPLNHRAPWKTTEHGPCTWPDAPVDTRFLERGPVVAVPRDDESPADE